LQQNGKGEAFQQREFEGNIGEKCEKNLEEAEGQDDLQARVYMGQK
jgi:hypothetical protein